MVEGIYRSRLTGGLDGKAASYLSSLEDDYWILVEDIVGTEAHDIMLCEQGIIPREDLKKILNSLEKLRGEALRGEVRLKDRYEDVHEFIESRVIDETGIEVGGRLHTARSRNDQVALDVRMKTRGEILETSRLLLNLLDTLLDRASGEVKTLIPLYTHTQHAQAGSLAHYLLSIAEALVRDCDRLDDCYRRVNLNPLGACAVGGTRFPIDRYRTTDLLGFDGLVENSLDAVSSRDFGVEALSCLSILMTHLGRLSEDLILWSSGEFGFIELADQYCSTSSIMPHKKNPCTLELLRARMGLVHGNLIGLLTLLKSVPSGYNRDLQESKNPLRSSFKLVKDSLEVMRGVVGTLSINGKRLREAVEKGYVMAVDLAETLSTALNLPFRLSHRVVAELVKRLYAGKLKLKGVKPGLLEEVLEEVAGVKVKVDRKMLALALNPSKSLSEKKSLGSPSPKEVERMIGVERDEVERCKRRLERRISYIDEAGKRLSRLVETYLEEK